jgi:hypothetical protein
MNTKALFSFLLLLSLLKAVAQDSLRIPCRMALPRNVYEQPQFNTDQLWPKFYEGNKPTVGLDVDECYDKGYLITGADVRYDGWHRMGILLKTDINGNQLWVKRIGFPPNGNNLVAMISSLLTKDGGILTCGMTTILDGENCELIEETLDAAIVKLNACGEKEWCKIYSVPCDIDYALESFQLANGNYLVLINFFGFDVVDKRVWLFCLSPQGETLWQKVYCQNATDYVSESFFTASMTADSNLIIAGECYVEDPLNPTWYYVVPHFTKIDTTGQEIYANAWTTDPNHYSGDITKSCIDHKGNYWTASKAYIADTLPFNCGPGALVHTHKNGNALKYLTYTQNLVLNEGMGRVTTVVELDTNLLFLTNIWGNYVPFATVNHVNAYLSDTNGVVLAEKELMVNDQSITKTILTSDHKVLMTAGHYFSQTKWDMYLYKLLPNLDYDTLDTRLLTYDSLCPHAIVSDTIPLDCDIVVGIDEAFSNPAKSSLRAFPNPASGSVTLQLPECYLSHSSVGSLSVQTANYVWPNGKQLELVNMQGQTISLQPWPYGQTSLTFSLEGLAPGTYIARITHKGQALCQCNVMVVK